MLAYIRSNYKAGDTMEIATSEGVITGAIEYVNDKYIVLRQPNGQICGIASSDIRTFRAECPVKLIAPVVPVTKAPAAPEADGTESEAPATTGTAAPRSSETDEEGTYAHPVQNLVEPKVVGHIDLDRLKQIDPKLSRRQYFKSAESNADAEEESTPKTAVWSSTANPRQPYVPAKGRITYYNIDKRYGFIHDYSTDNDLYFNLQQVADYGLYDHLHKGTKVAYSISRNLQGYVAQCVHLPHTVEDLLPMAEDYFDSRHYNLAQGLAEHILDVCPDNKEAQNLLEEIHNVTPAPRFAGGRENGTAGQYNPYIIYSQAKKAYLAKDYAQAEELYKKAIDANEKPESCVKDLVTLYVSRYKQTADETEKAAAREKAVNFLDSHRDMLPDNLTTKQFLALNYYLPIQEYEKFISTVDEILEDPQVSDIISRRVFYIWQKSIALNKMGRTDEALALTEQGLLLAPHSRQLINLKNMIEHPELFQHEEAEGEAQAASGSEAPSAEATADAEESPAPAESGEPAGEEEEAPAAEAVKDDTTGEAKPDSWWEDLKKPAE